MNSLFDDHHHRSEDRVDQNMHMNLKHNASKSISSSYPNNLNADTYFTICDQLI